MYTHCQKRQIIHSNFRSTSATTETRPKIGVISSRLKTEIRHHQPERFSSDTRSSRWFRWYPVSGTNGGTSVSLIEELMDQRVSVGACKIGLAVWRKRGVGFWLGNGPNTWSSMHTSGNRFLPRDVLSFIRETRRNKSKIEDSIIKCVPANQRWAKF